MTSAIRYIQKAVSFCIAIICIFTFTSKAQNAPIAVKQDSTITFIKDGVGVSGEATLSCDDLNDLSFKCPMPANFAEKFDKVRFFITINSDEFKSREFMKGQFSTYMINANTWGGVIVNHDKDKMSAFDGLKMNQLTKNDVCARQSDAGFKTYKLTITAKGYTQTGEDKHGDPVFRRQVIISQGEINIKAPKVGGGL